MKVLAFGEVLWDFIDGDKYFGGAPVNFAAHVVQCGEKAAIVTALGIDRLGDQALEQIRNAGLSDEFVQRVDEKITGRVMVMLTDGQPTYRIKKDVAYDYIESSLLDLNKIKQYDAFYFGTLAQRSAISRQTLQYILQRRLFNTVFYDVNLRRESYTKEVIEESFRYSTIVKMNADEVATLSQLIYYTAMTPELFVVCLQEGYPQIEIVLVTDGAKGCTVFTHGQKYQIASEPVEVKDTIGAGDSFCAAFLTTYLRTGDPKKAARIGNLVGGFVASENGAIPVYSDRFQHKVKVLSGTGIPLERD